MIYLKPHTEDSRKNELCDYCRFHTLCNGKNKTYAPMLTACACNIALCEEAAQDVEQENGKITVKRNALRYSQNMTAVALLLERLYCADILCDTPHTNDELRRAVYSFLADYYGKEYETRLANHPNEKPYCKVAAPHSIPQNALDPYGSEEPLITAGLLA